MSSLHLVIMAAGTGGHIIPGIAVAQEMRARGWSVSWLGTQAGMENRLVGFDLYRAEAVHSAHVCRTIHLVASSGRLGKPVPTMLSRVTRSASCASLQPSVPSGRSGITR